MQIGDKNLHPEQLHHAGPLLKTIIFGGSFGSAVDVKNEI